MKDTFKRKTICPECKGKGTVLIQKNFGKKLDYCPVCNGKKIIYKGEEK